MGGRGVNVDSAGSAVSLGPHRQSGPSMFWQERFWAGVRLTQIRYQL